MYNYTVTRTQCNPVYYYSEKKISKMIKNTLNDMEFYLKDLGRIYMHFYMHAINTDLHVLFTLVQNLLWYTLFNTMY